MKLRISAPMFICVWLPVAALVVAWASMATLADGGASASAAEDSTTEGSPADNSNCFVCHADYEDESLVTRHARKGVGCTDCHGDSWEHIEDEDHTTPPEVMYCAESIDRACRKCHDTHDAPARIVVRRWLDRCRTKTRMSELVCTDCHGRHRLETRKVRWDKRTGKLIDEEK